MVTTTSERMASTTGTQLPQREPALQRAAMSSASMAPEATAERISRSLTALQ